eukprot:7119766-Prymnesium_polylepis.1
MKSCVSGAAIEVVRLTCVQPCMCCASGHFGVRRAMGGLFGGCGALCRHLGLDDTRYRRPRLLVQHFVFDEIRVTAEPRDRTDC